MPLTHVVIKSVVSPERRHITGELVDPSRWNMPVGRLQKLEDQRHIRPVPRDVEVVPTVDGRFWAGTEWPRKYGLQIERPPRAAEVARAESGRAPDGDEAAGDDGGDDGASGPQGDVNATPAAVALAEKHEIDLSEVTGTGDGGRITKPDVSALIDGQ